MLDTLKSTAEIARSESSKIKMLVFAIGKLTLGLPVERVIKVTKYTPLHGSGMTHVNLTHIGKQEVTVVDLHQKLFKVSLDELSPDGGYFILSKAQSPLVNSDRNPNNLNLGEENIGIRVLEAPSLIDIALSDIRILPNSYRYADTLEIASHVAVVDRQDSPNETIFILDLKCLI